MMSRRITSRRPRNALNLRSVFWYASEGTVTEIEYIEELERLYTNVKFNHVASHNNPKAILQKLRQCEKGRSTIADTYFVAFIDRDSWQTTDINRLLDWERKDPAHRLVLICNPCFELWLLRHFESGVGASTQDICRQRLKRYFPEIGNKHIPKGMLTRAACGNACNNSRTCSSQTWRIAGFTNVHRLIVLLDSLSPSEKS